MNSLTGRPLTCCDDIENGGGGPGPGEDITLEDLPLSLTSHLGTGLIVGGEITINVDNTKFDVAGGAGVIYNTGVASEVVWSGQTTSMITGVPVTYVLIDVLGVVFTTATPPTAEVSRDNIYLGVTFSEDTLTISVTEGAPTILTHSANQIRDLADSIGDINRTGNIIQDAGTLDLAFMKSAGESFAYAANFETSPKNPHIKTDDIFMSNPDGYRYAMLNGSLSPIGLTFLIPNILDDGSPYPGTTYANNRWGASRVYLTRDGNIIFTPPQTSHGNARAAFESTASPAYVANPLLDPSSLLLAFVATRGGATNATLDTDVIFAQASKFGTGGGGGSIPEQETLQTVYNNSATTGTQMDTAVGVPFSIDSSAGTDSEQVLTVGNNGFFINKRGTLFTNAKVDAGEGFQSAEYFHNVTATPTTPTAGIHKNYFKNDGKYYTLDSLGQEKLVGVNTLQVAYDEGLTNFLHIDVSNTLVPLTIGSSFAGSQEVLRIEDSIGNPNIQVYSNGNISSAGLISGLQISTPAMEISGNTQYTEVATQPDAASGSHRLYFKADGGLYTINDLGTEREIGGDAAPPVVPATYFSTEFLYPATLNNVSVNNLGFGTGTVSTPIGSFGNLLPTMLGGRSKPLWTGLMISGSYTPTAAKPFTVIMNIYNVTQGPAIVGAITTSAALPNTASWKQAFTCVLTVPVSATAQYYLGDQCELAGQKISDLDPAWLDTDRYIGSVSLQQGNTISNSIPGGIFIEIDWESEEA